MTLLRYQGEGIGSLTCVKFGPVPGADYSDAAARAAWS